MRVLWQEPLQEGVVVEDRVVKRRGRRGKENEEKEGGARGGEKGGAKGDGESMRKHEKA